jgi:ribosomal protein L11 methyltransferase
MAWLQLALIATREQVALLETVLEAAGALAVTLDDPAGTATDPQPSTTDLLEPAPGAMPLWALVRLTALFADQPEARVPAEQVARVLQPALAAPVQWQRLADQVWERTWLEHWQPRCFGSRLWVCPHHQAPEDPTAVVVKLDPGLAFGTGSHPTTALCLEWLAEQDLTGKTLIDYGCGSGILAIAALKLGAAGAIAVDYDPQALSATLDNARANGVAERLRLYAPEALPDDLSAPLLVANILAGVLVERAPRLMALCQVSGVMALSGILEPQIPQVLAAYRQQIQFAAPVVEAQWALLHGQRTTPH